MHAFAFLFVDLFCIALRVYFFITWEFVVRFKDLSLFVALYEKHSIKVREPNFPVAAAERGRCVIVVQKGFFQLVTTISKKKFICAKCFICDLRFMV